MIRPSQSQSRTTVLLGGLLLTVGYGLTQWALPRHFEPIRDTSFSMRRLRLLDRIEAAPSKRARAPLLVSLGSSRTLNAIDGEVAERELSQRVGAEVHVANFAAPGGTPLNSLVILGRLLRHGPPPDVVLVEVHPVFLRDAPIDDLFTPTASPLSTADLEFLKTHHLEPGSKNQPIDRGWLALWNYRNDIVKIIAPWLGYRGTSPWWNLADDWGGVMHERIPATPAEHQALIDFSHLEYFDKLQNYRFGGPSVRALAAILEECRQRRIPAALVITPEGPIFRGWYPPNLRDKILHGLQSLADQHDAQLVNCWEWHPESDFIDSHHFQAKGASKYTARLCRELSQEWNDQFIRIAREPAPTALR